MDQKEGALGEADSGSPPIVPGDVEASEVYARLIADDDLARLGATWRWPGSAEVGGKCIQFAVAPRRRDCETTTYVYHFV